MKTEDYRDNIIHKIVCKNNNYSFTCDNLHSVNALAVMFSALSIPYTVYINYARSIELSDATKIMRLNAKAYEEFMINSGYAERIDGKVKLVQGDIIH